MHVFDRRRDRQTDGHLSPDQTALHSMQCGKKMEKLSTDRSVQPRHGSLSPLMFEIDYIGCPFCRESNTKCVP